MILRTKRTTFSRNILFFFNDTATTEIYTLSLHDALPIFGSGLSGVLYVLDEPSIGLHQRDNDRLLVTLQRLRDLGNTVLVVEHDEDAIRHADHVIDMGPGAGVHGGEVVAQGKLEDVLANENSLTADYLTGRRSVPIPAKRRKGSGKKLQVVGANANNLRNITASIPLGTFTC